MSNPSRKFWNLSLTALAVIGLLTGLIMPLTSLTKAQAATTQGGTTPDYVKGPFSDAPVYPTVFNGDLRDLPQQPPVRRDIPAPRTFPQGNQINSTDATSWVDPVAQHSLVQGQMPAPIANFAGLDFLNNGSGWPPDTNGDVGPTYYIQTVNTSMGIFNKTSGALVVALDYDTFFQGPVGTVCDNANAGDVVVLYDPQVDRWVITDFAWVNYNTGPYYECIAVSQSGDPVGGGWYFYALRADTGGLVGFLNDYPKLGVWADGWYMTANMFGPANFAVRVWALDRTSMIAGGAANEQHFDCTDLTFCASLLPANVRGALPPAGSPEYFANVMFPNSLNIWQFHVDWATPGNSTFTGPVTLQVADFQGADAVPQKNSNELVDSLGDRMMFSLQYRNLDGVEALYANHSVISGGVDGIRWYEVRDPGGTPVLYQQGTYQPDQNYRWMGSIAADGDGNIAVGYSVSSSLMFPAIYYAGRLAGESPNLLTQNETLLVAGTGSQQGGYGRWGDYSAMTIDPNDDCTFWYTQEYYITTGNNWQTRIGSFKFPSCGQPKGHIDGFVYNTVTNLPVVGAPVVAAGVDYSFNATTDSLGYYTMTLTAGSYDMTAGPLLPGYPGTDTANGVTVVAGNTTAQDFHLAPTPSLVDAGVQLSDSVPGGNGNGYPEPGEQGLLLSESLYNQGAITSTLITAKLSSLTSGVTIDAANSTYPDITAGSTLTNTTPYVFSIDPSVPCGTDLNFQAVVTDSVNTYNTAFSLNASVPLPRQYVFTNTVEGGDMGWTTGGTLNTWAITTEDAHSPTHSWTDSPGGNYSNNTNSWLRTPAFDLTGRRHTQLSGWFKYGLEAGFDYVYVEYSLDGGTTWNPTPLATFNGFSDWQYGVIDASVLDNQPNIALRVRLVSDAGVTEDGIHLDDIALSYEPYVCGLPGVPTLISPANESWGSSPVTFVWQPAAVFPAEGFTFYLDDTPVMTFTTPVTTTTLDVSPWGHSWFVKATNTAGASQPSQTWSFDVFGKFFLPITSK
jgi:Carboxypeptidase regulatory-like domain